MIDKSTYRQQIIYFIFLTILTHFLINIEMLADLKRSIDFSIGSLSSELVFLKSLGLILISLFYYLSYWYLMNVLIFTCPLLLTYTPLPKIFINLFCIELATMFSLFSIIDFYIFKNYGFHIGKTCVGMFSHTNNLHLLLQDIKNNLSISDLELRLFFGITAFLHIIFLSLFHFSKKLALKQKSTFDLKFFYCIFIYGLLSSYFSVINPIKEKHEQIIHQINQYPFFKLGINQLINWHVIPDYGYVLPSLSIHSSRNLKAPQLSTITTKNKPNILWIVIDTLRYDAISPSLTPSIYEFSQQNIEFINHWSAGNSTLSGVFGMLYGLPSNYFSATINQHLPPLLFQLLEKTNYEQHVFFSGSLQNPPFIENAFHQFPNDHIHLNPYQSDGNEDTRTIQQLTNFLKKPHKQAFFSFVMLDSVHQYCRRQNYKKYYHSNISPCLRWGIKNDLDPRIFRNRYENAVHHVDGLLKSVFEILKNSELENNTIVIFTSDHGESFNDYKTNLWGHSNGYTPNLLHVPFILHLPSKAQKQIPFQTSHYDIPITLLKLIFDFKQTDEQFLMGHDLFSPHSWSFLLAGSYVNMALVTEKEYFLIDPDGEIKAFTNQASPLPNSKIPSNLLYKALQLMSKFYAP